MLWTNGLLTFSEKTTGVTSIRKPRKILKNLLMSIAITASIDNIKTNPEPRKNKERATSGNRKIP